MCISRAYWTLVELGFRTCFRIDHVCPDGLQCSLLAGQQTLISISHYCELLHGSHTESSVYLLWVAGGVHWRESLPRSLTVKISGKAVLLPLSAPWPGCSHLLFCVSVPLQPTPVCSSSSLSVHLMEVGNPVRCLQRVLPNLLAAACARSSVIASSTLGGMKVALANSNWNAK